MVRGKHTCRILKEIRRRIAEANDIDLVISECHYKGDCLGTCPKCEAEVRYLEKQLRARSLAGKAIALAGLSAGMIFLSGCTNSSSTNSAPSTPDTVAIYSPATDRDSDVEVVLTGDVAEEINIRERPADESFVPDPEKIYEHPDEYPKLPDNFIGLMVKETKVGYGLVEWKDCRNYPKKQVSIKFVVDTLGRASDPVIINNNETSELIRPYLEGLINQLPRLEPGILYGHKVKSYGRTRIIIIEDKKE